MTIVVGYVPTPEGEAALTAAGVPVLVAGGVALLAVVAVLVLRRVRPEAVTRRRSTASGAVDEEGLGAADYRSRARAASELPGRTAYEVALALATVFPEHAEPLATTAAVFDVVRYGHGHASRAQAESTTELDTALLRSRPHLAPLGAP